MADDYFNLLARCSVWANGPLGEAEFKASRRTFFGSIHATLNHILVGARLWTSRPAGALWYWRSTRSSTRISSTCAPHPARRMGC